MNRIPSSRFARSRPAGTGLIVNMATIYLEGAAIILTAGAPWPRVGRGRAGHRDWA